MLENLLCGELFVYLPGQKLHDGLKRTPWDVDFKNPLGNCGVPEEVKIAHHPQVNLFLFIFFFSRKP